jgi:hypothetical protein
MNLRLVDFAAIRYEILRLASFLRSLIKIKESTNYRFIRTSRCAQKQDRIAYLISMRCRNENDGTCLGDFPSSSGMYFAKEEVYQNGQCPEDQIVKPWYL